jgi:hypothetical protein
MANLTVVIDDSVLLEARKRALDQGTSVNALLRNYLESYVGREPHATGMERFVEQARATGGRSSKAWKRSDLHER